MNKINPWLLISILITFFACQEAQDIEQNISDTTNPIVLSTIPNAGYEGHYWNSAIVVTFNKDMDAATVENPANFIVQDSTATDISGTRTYSAIAKSLIFVPSANWQSDEWYTVQITTDALDLSGTPLEDLYTFTFKTNSSPAPRFGSDSIQPAVSILYPRGGSIDIATDSAISATFSENINPLTIDAASFAVTDGTSNIPGRIALCCTK